MFLPRQCISKLFRSWDTLHPVGSLLFFFTHRHLQELWIFLFLSPGDVLIYESPHLEPGLHPLSLGLSADHRHRSAHPPALTDGPRHRSSSISSVSQFSSEQCHMFFVLSKFSGVEIIPMGEWNQALNWGPDCPPFWVGQHTLSLLHAHPGHGLLLWGQTSLWRWALSASGLLSTNSPTFTPGLGDIQYQKLSHASSRSR